MQSLSFLDIIINVALRTLHFLQVRKEARVIYIVKLGKDPALPTSHHPFNVFDTIDKFIEKS
jgi:hypothetical protein